jgi:hypothetical protein
MSADRTDRDQPRRRGVTRALSAGVVGVLMVTVLTLVAPPASAQDAGEPPVVTTLRPLPEDAGRIIKRPNYGHAPTHPGDRGGWQQTLVLLLVVGAVGGGVALVWRDSARRRRPAPPAPAPDRTTAPSRP